jgi:hypothetical protein
MKNIAIVAAVFVMLGFAGVSGASDWDLVGKVLTGIEGARIITGGKIDVIGSVMDIGRGGPRGQNRVIREKQVIVVEKPVSRDRIWVPEYRMEEVWVPVQTVHDRKCGNVYIGGHYVQYKVEDGGHWEYASGRGRDVCYAKARRH